jgi:hypothetical protein
MARENARDYFRVECQVLLGIRDTGATQVRGTTPDSYFPDSHHLNLLRDLSQIDHENAHLLHAINDRDRNLSAYLGAINRKIDTVARHLVSQLPAEVAGSEQTVSLSEGGISFVASRALEAGSTVALHLTLLPSYVGLASFARIVHREAHDGGYRLSASFEGLAEGDRQLLARHVMQVQLAQQRKRSVRD